MSSESLSMKRVHFEPDSQNIEQNPNKIGQDLSKNKTNHKIDHLNKDTPTDNKENKDNAIITNTESNIDDESSILGLEYGAQLATHYYSNDNESNTSENESFGTNELDIKKIRTTTILLIMKVNNTKKLRDEKNAIEA